MTGSGPGPREVAWTRHWPQRASPFPFQGGGGRGDSACVCLVAQVRLHPQRGSPELQDRRGLWGPEDLGTGPLAGSPLPPGGHTWQGRGETAVWWLGSEGPRWEPTSESGTVDSSFPLEHTARPALRPDPARWFPGCGGVGRPGDQGDAVGCPPTGQSRCPGVAMTGPRETSVRPA